MQRSISNIGKYTITENQSGFSDEKEEEAGKAISAADSIFRLFGFIVCGSLLVEWGIGGFNWRNWLINFTGGFLLLSSLYKLISLRRFSKLFTRFDFVSRAIPFFGIIYPILQFILSICLLAHLMVRTTIIVTMILIKINLPGVIVAIVKKKHIPSLGSIIQISLIKFLLVENSILLILCSIIFFTR